MHLSLGTRTHKLPSDLHMCAVHAYIHTQNKYVKKKKKSQAEVSPCKGRELEMTTFSLLLFRKLGNTLAAAL